MRCRPLLTTDYSRPESGTGTDRGTNSKRIHYYSSTPTRSGNRRCFGNGFVMRIQFVLSLSVSLLSLAVHGQDFFRVSPPGFDIVEGNSAGLGGFTLGASRFQQVYPAVTFLSATRGTNAVAIEHLSFRLDSGAMNGISLYYTNLHVSLSTSQRGPSDLSAVFAENLGQDVTVIHERGELLSMISPWSGSPSVQSLFLTFDLDTPFYYNPAHGNLLLEIQNYGGVVMPPFPPGLRIGPLDGVANHPLGGSVFAMGGDSATGTVLPFSLLTGIGGQMVPVPEPSGFALVALGILLGVGFIVSRRNKGGIRGTD